MADASPTEKAAPTYIWYDKVIFHAEVQAIAYGWFAFGLLCSGIFILIQEFPGEKDLCNAETLGLTKDSDTKARLILKSCHGCYRTIFAVSAATALPFILGSLWVGLSAALAWSSARTHDLVVFNKYTKYCMALALLGAILGGLPVVGYTIATVTVNAWSPFVDLLIETFHYGMLPSDQSHMSASMKHALYLENTLHDAYEAIGNTILGISIGTMCLWGILTSYCVDVIRTCRSVNGAQPQYELHQGDGTIFTLVAWKNFLTCLRTWDENACKINPCKSKFARALKRCFCGSEAKNSKSERLLAA